ncbi:hypothetical protein P171DRAFT_484726 [Karstenula rhodostoma CBS 690.94]|uniref:Transcription factor domain-containing protein n=1 Tax=Karstenula rhodostoma CBS 690.94 TaxID=1392251 RepID=A0A9P4PKK1_9PLEO|nr:hypothetical protein P171DRAFT_484726 [Karstenula rhodostoma CBS 690.94]
MDDHNDSRPGSRSRRPPKRPQQFMFIDSTGANGVNAKPDKNVRSFVMKSARSKKPWSTRQKEKSTSPSEDNPHIPRREANIAESISPTLVSPSWQHAAAPTTWSAPSNLSPVSSRNGSVLSTRSRSQPYVSPPSSSCSLCDNPQCAGDLCTQPHASNQLVNRRGFSFDFIADLDCLPVPTDSNTRDLLENFIHTYAISFVPLDQHHTSNKATTNWISKSILSSTGASFIYVIFTASALYRQAIGAANAQDVLQYKISAISEINKQLSNRTSRIDDNNIAAVFMLLCIEEGAVSSDQDKEWAQLQRQLHLDGLKTMIQQRGGLSALKSNQCLQTFILMHSVAHAVSTFERPYATLMDSTGHIQQYDIPSFRGRPASTRTLRLFHPLKLDPDLYDLISNIVVFVGDLNVWNDNRKCPVDPIEMQKHICLLVYRLFDWYKRGEEDPSLPRQPVDQSLCLALTIFLIVAYNQNYGPMVYAASQRLKAALEKCLFFNWANAADLLTWTLTMGGLATRGTDDFEFYRQYSIGAFKSQGFAEDTNPEEVLDRMRKCLWLGKLDKHVKDMWAEMGICRGEDVMDMSSPSEMKSPDRIKKEDIVGGLTNERFFVKRP